MRKSGKIQSILDGKMTERKVWNNYLGYVINSMEGYRMAK